MDDITEYSSRYCRQIFFRFARNNRFALAWGSSFAKNPLIFSPFYISSDNLECWSLPSGGTTPSLQFFHHESKLTSLCSSFGSNYVKKICALTRYSTLRLQRLQVC